MASLKAPPGDPASPAVCIAAALAKLGLAVEAPDADLKEAVLNHGTGQVVGATAILQWVADKGAGSGLVPSEAKADVELWLGVAQSIEQHSRAWVEPFSSSGDDATRSFAQVSITSSLQALEAHFGSGKSTLAGSDSNLSLADVYTACVVAPLLSGVISAGARAPFPKVLHWFQATVAKPEVSKVLGSVTLCAAAGDAWVVPAAKAGGKKKKAEEKGAAAAPAAGAAAAADDDDMDPEKAAKKAAKKAEKAAKAAKLAAKQAALEEKAKAKEGGDKNEKKVSAKAEAEAKKKAEAEEVASLIAAAQATAKGAKKDMATAMFKAYHPKLVEAAWYDWWEQCGFFKPDVNSDKPPFVIVIPPPNVTGALHIGHALTDAIEDSIVRWRRMSGYNVLWVPGTDHAGIATQTVVEKKLKREQGLTRHQLGREPFVAEVWKWVDDYGHRICDQIRRMGASVDWSRFAFTMDATRSAAVNEAFVRMHEQGCIYRDIRLVNWCCRLKTAVSDIEVDYIDIPKRTFLTVPGYDKQVEFGVITSFAYPLEDGSGEIVVATTRPETMLGDTAVAIHPDDERYKAMQGKHVVHPVNGRRIPIICDAELVDMAFGTGCVKVTPAHDPNDFATGKRHNLEFINIFDDNGLINEHGGPFKGQPRFQTRVEIVDFLKEKGLFRGVADNAMRLGLCSRSKDVIEPMIKPQWWVNCKDSAAKSCQAVRDGTLEIIPKEFEAVWFRWLENIRDWCISRQLWWGHRIPAYYVVLDGEAVSTAGPGMPSEDMSRWVVGRTQEEAQARAAALHPGRTVTLVQDEDVLDTWFSSGLFPFSTMGWPEQTPDLAKFYPGALLETGHDILFFWVARMVMMGIQITGQVPFKQVYLHAMIRDAHGRKMSKSLGNVIDPLHVIEGITLEGLHGTLLGGNLDPKEVERAKTGQSADFPEGIEECGTDALRFALMAYTTQARDINLDIKRVVAYRHWCNKLWNAIKFAMMNLPDGFVPAAALDPSGSPASAAEASSSGSSASFPLPSRWILSRLNSAIATTVKAMEEYDFASGTQALYGFWQYDLCDVFIELMKPVMALPDDSGGPNDAAKRITRDTLWTCLDNGLRLLHPFMPFVTEELWQRLPKRADQVGIPSIVVAPYPTPQPSWVAPQLEKDMEFVMALVNKTRKLRSDYGLVRQRPHIYVSSSDPAKAAVLSALASEVATLTTSSDTTVVAAGAAGGVPEGCSVAIVDDATTVHMMLKGVLDPNLEIQKLQKKVDEINGKLEGIARKMALPSYDKTPDNVKADDKERQAKSEAELAAAQAAIADMRKLLEAQ